MRKIKEFLLLFVPFIVFSVIPIIILITGQDKIMFFSNAHYLALILNDGIFYTAFLNTYGKSIVFSLLAAVFLALLCHSIKHIKTRKFFYPASIVLVSVVSFLAVYLDRLSFFGLPMGVYEPNDFIAILPYDICFALQFGFLIAFLFWSLESLILFIKKKRTIHK